jgi:hypothetical protein
MIPICLVLGMNTAKAVASGCEHVVFSEPFVFVFIVLEGDSLPEFIFKTADLKIHA